MRVQERAPREVGRIPFCFTTNQGEGFDNISITYSMIAPTTTARAPWPNTSTISVQDYLQSFPGRSPCCESVRSHSHMLDLLGAASDLTKGRMRNRYLQFRECRLNTPIICMRNTLRKKERCQPKLARISGTRFSIIQKRFHFSQKTFQVLLYYYAPNSCIFLFQFYLFV